MQSGSLAKINSGPRLAYQRGSSLVSVMVGIGIMGIIAFIMMESFKTNVRAIQTVEYRGELEDLRNFVRAGMSCAKTFQGGTSCNGTIAIKTKTGAVRVGSQSNPTTVGSYTLTASCSMGAAKQIQVQAAQEGREPVSLFQAVPLVCP